MSIAKYSQEIVENAHSKPQETLEFKMTKQKEPFSFDVPLNLEEKWMIGVTSLEVYNTVYNITNSNNKLEIVLNDQQLKELNLDSELLVLVEALYKAYFVKPYRYSEFIEKVNKLKTNSYSKKKKLTRVDFTYLTKIIESSRKNNAGKHKTRSRKNNSSIQRPPKTWKNKLGGNKLGGNKFGENKFGCNKPRRNKPIKSNKFTALWNYWKQFRWNTTNTRSLWTTWYKYCY